MPEILTDQAREARIAIPAVEPNPTVVMFRKECDECRGPIKWIDPAALATLDREAFVEFRRQHGIEALLNGDLWVCLKCDNLGLMAERGDF